jgi:hypothetical protein
MSQERVQRVKASGQGRWVDVLVSCGFPAASLDGRNHPCPKCGGTDRFRLIAEDRGAVFCNACFSSKNGDALSAIMWFSGAPFPDALAQAERALGLSNGTHQKKPNKPLGQEVERYGYCDENGIPLFDVVRFEPKDFRQQAVDGRWTIKGIRQVPYHLRKLLSDPEATIFVVEGEKDVLSLEALGLVATTNPGGAGKWKNLDPYALKTAFTDRDVVILGECDKSGAGQKHVVEVQESLAALAKRLKVIPSLPHPPDRYETGWDVSDWLQEGGTLQELQTLVSVQPDVAGKPAEEKKRKSLFEIRDTFLAPAIKPRDWAVGGMFLTTSFALLAGHQKGGKTTFALQLAISMQLGLEFLGRKIFLQGSFAVVECDSSRDNLFLDIQAIAQGLGAQGPAPLKYGLLHTRGLDLADKSMRDALFEDLEALEPKIVILDPFRKLMLGSDNSSQDVLPVTDFCSMVAEKLKCLVLLADHLKKSPDKADKGDAPLAELIRGSSHKGASADTVMLFSKDEKNTQTKVVMSDQKHAGCLPPFSIKMEGDPEDPNSPKKLVLVGGATESTATHWPDTLTLAVWDYVRLFPDRGFNEIDNAVDGNRAAKLGAVAKLEARGYLVITTGRRNKKEHRISPKGKPVAWAYPPLVPTGSRLVPEPVTCQVVPVVLSSFRNEPRFLEPLKTPPESLSSSEEAGTSQDFRQEDF